MSDGMKVNHFSKYNGDKVLYRFKRLHFKNGAKGHPKALFGIELMINIKGRNH